MKKAVYERTKRNIHIGGNRTSLVLESPCWLKLDQIAAARGTSSDDLVRKVMKDKPADVAMTAALRCFAVSNSA